MKVYLKFDYPQLTKKVIQEKLLHFGYEFNYVGFGELDISDNIPEDALTDITNTFKEYGIEIVENQKSALVQKIKDAIVEMVFNDENAINIKSSVYLSEKLNHSFGYLSNLFSEVTYTSLENFIILQKIERVKQLIIINELSLTEIAYLLSYSSVAHLSTQFKNTTGITPSAFQRIIKKRRENLNQ